MKKRESPVIFLARALLFFQSPGKGLSYLSLTSLTPQCPNRRPKGSDCKVRTQEAENFDEEDKSLVSAWSLSLRRERRAQGHVLVTTERLIKTKPIR